METHMSTTMFERFTVQAWLILTVQESVRIVGI